MFPGMNQRQAAQMMKKMGIKQEEIDAKEVIIKLEDKEWIIKEPQVVKVNMMGQETLQITGDIEERDLNEKAIEADIMTIVEQTDCTLEEAKKALEDNEYDIAAAILSLKKDD